MRESLTKLIGAALLAACGDNNGFSSSTPVTVAPQIAPSLAMPGSGRPRSPAGVAQVRIREFALPHGDSEPLGIAAGPDGSVWFTEFTGNRIGRITYHGKITEFALPHNGSTPVDIVAGPDGNMWFTEGSGNRIGRITPQGTIAEFSRGLDPNSSPNGITAATDSVWFTEVGEYPNGIKVGQIRTDGRITKQYSIPTAYNSNPQNLAFGWDGKLWLAEANAGNAIGRCGRFTGTCAIFQRGLKFGAYPQGIAAGPDGNMWFTESGRPTRIGRVTKTGTIAEFSSGISKCNCNYNLYGIAAGTDGNLWFTEQSTDKIARITTAGKVTEFSKGLSASSGPAGIAAGLRGTLWFSEQSGNRIARVQLMSK